MNIAYSSSEYYFRPTYVSIYSLLSNCSRPQHIILLSSGVSRESKNSLIRMVKQFDSKITIIEVESLLEEKAKQYGFPKMRGNYSTYARIFLAEVLPDLQDVLLIDSDTLVLGDIELYQKQLLNYPLMASRDYVISNLHSRHEDLDLSKLEYWNMGVLYLNLEKWRSLRLMEYIDLNLHRAYEPLIADQSIINKCLRQHIGTVNIDWNFYTYFHYSFDWLFYSKMNNKTPFITSDDLALARSNPKIIHFIGTWYERPWYKKNISKYNDTYQEYWKKCFNISDLMNAPSLPFKSKLYDGLSIAIYKILGEKIYFNFRYILIQKIKAIMRMTTT